MVHVLRLNRVLSLAMPTLAALVASVAPTSVRAQSRSFVVRLGADTSRIEKVVRTGNKIDGTVVSHLPITSVLKYAITLNADGTVASYEQGSYRGDGTPAPNSPQGVQATGIRIVFASDSVTRSWTANGQPVSRHHAVPKGTLPSIGGSYLMVEMGIAAARAAGATSYKLISATSAQDNPSTVDLVLVSADSVEVVQQGFRTGYKLDKNGRIVRGDGSLTTQKLIGVAAGDIDADALAKGWAARDAAGQGVGVASTRDTARATLGGATVTLDYGRPAKRGREIWGALVPFDTVWRFGANAAAQLKTDKDIDIGGTTVPAGAYTVWLLPTKGTSLLVISKKTVDERGTPLWGTGYDPSQDLARIPLAHHSGLAELEERFHVFFQGDLLMLHWDKAGYGVKVKAK